MNCERVEEAQTPRRQIELYRGKSSHCGGMGKESSELAVALLARQVAFAMTPAEQAKAAIRRVTVVEGQHHVR